MMGLLQVIVMAATILAAVSWLVVVFLAPAQPSPAATSSRQRLFAARCWLFAPLWVPAALLAAAMARGVVDTLVDRSDHCLTHAAAHYHHLCLVHPPHAAQSALSWMLPLGLLVPLVVVLLRWLRQAQPHWRLARTLAATSRPSELGPDVRLLDQPEPLALTVGWRKPTVLLSTGLLANIGIRTRDVVLAHERAHVARRDTWFALLDRLAASLLPRAVADPLMARITLACEQACDAIAAERVGSTLDVARALADVTRLEMKLPASAVAIGSGDIEARVSYLLHPPKCGRWPWLAPLALAIGIIAAGSGPVHTATEQLINFLLH